ncbi:hypothetical protein [Paraburkholderia humisilvae]|uniref:Uncharacterized protein n=1 Tax=Paraburkholderia humisilvae TaxID=627669 RepID=A0A6J5EZI6_9BURK|nr:hypothetical protein [Paraburkholderia humisilvae]CAB3771553.1 hypothetical protein LMG29542_06644 [Paraburkholderia humisilvae]
MIRFSTFHGGTRVEPGSIGTPETNVPDLQSQQPARAEQTRRSTGHTAGGPLPSAGSPVHGRPARAATGAAGNATGYLPDAYIGVPKGDLQSDPRHAGVLIDETGQPYVPVGGHYYAVRSDTTNGTWRAVQLQEPVKPGIPIRRDAAGNWHPHGDAGGPGGKPLPTRAQLQSDLRATEATLHELTVRRIGQRHDMFDLRDMLHEHETFREDTRAGLAAARSELALSRGMAEYFARQIERGDPDISFRSGLERMAHRIEDATRAIAGLQRLIDQAGAERVRLRSRIAAANADVERTTEEILRARIRLIELDGLSNSLD